VHKIAKNTFFFTTASIGQKVIAFVYFLFVARIMMPENTGVYFLALSIITIFSVIADFGITSVVIREIARFPEQTVSIIRRALGLKIPFLFLGVLGSLCAGFFLGYDPFLRSLIAFACLVLTLDAFSLLFYGVLRGHHQLQYESLGMFVGQGITALFGACALFFFPILPLLIAALIAGSGFNFLFSSFRVARLYGTHCLLPSWQKETSLLFLRTAFPFALAAIFVKIYSYTDSILIAKYLGNEAVGIYSVAYKYTYAFQFLPLAFVAALYPGLSELIEKDLTALRHIFEKAMWYMAVLVTPIVFGLWAIAFYVVRLAGEGYAASGPVLAILVFALFPIFLDYPIGSLLNAAYRQSTKTVIMGITMMINVLLNVWLIPLVGVPGAAIAALVSFSFMFFAGLFFVPKIIPGYPLWALGKICLPIFLSGGVMAVVAKCLLLIFPFWMVIPFAALIYGALLFATKSIPREYLTSLRVLWRKEPSIYVE